MRHRCSFVIPSLIAGGLVCLASPARGFDFEWVGGASQNWFDAANWQENGSPTKDVPGCDQAGVAAVIKGGFGPILTRCEFGTISLGSVNSQSRLDINDTMTLAGPSVLTDPVSLDFFRVVANSSLELEGANGVLDRGELDGTGIVFNNGTINLDGVGIKVAFHNTGTVNQTSDTFLTTGVGGDPTITNTGVWSGRGGVAQFGANTSFENDGGTVRADGPTILRFTIPLHMSEGGGTLHAQSGDLRISLGGTHAGAGSYLADDGRTLIFDLFPGALPVTIAGDYAASGAGDLRLANEMIIEADASLTANLTGDDGFLLDTGAAMTINGTFTNNGTMTWKSGSIDAGLDSTATNTGSVRIASGGSSTPTLATFSELTNQGTWRVESDFQVDVAAAFVTESGGVVEVRGGDLEGLGLVEVNLNGLLLRPIDAPGTFSRVLAVCHLDGGQLISEAGEIRFQGGGLWRKAGVEPQENATIALWAGDYDITGGLAEAVTFSGDGVLSVRAGGTLRCDGVANNDIGMDGIGAFRLGESGSGGTLTGGGVFRNRGYLLVNGQTIDVGGGGEPVIPEQTNALVNTGLVQTGSPNTKISGLFECVDGGEFDVDHNTQVVLNDNGDGVLGAGDNGLITQTNATVSVVEGAGVFVAGGEWRLDGTSNLSGAGSLSVGGLIRKTGAGTESVVSLAEVNFFGGAVVKVESGTLLWDGEITGGSKTEVDYCVTADGILEAADGMVTNELEDAVDELKAEATSGAAAGPGAPPRLITPLLQHGGRLRPGGPDGTGRFVVEGDMVILETGILAASIGGPTAGVDHDQLTVTGDVTLGGRLRLHLVNDYTPTPGDTFVILAADGGVTGDFDQVIADGGWTVDVVGSSVVATFNAAPTCAPDFDLDGGVGPSDLAALLAQWGFAPSSAADFNGDDQVDAADLATLLATWGGCS